MAPRKKVIASSLEEASGRIAELENQIKELEGVNAAVGEEASASLGEFEIRIQSLEKENAALAEQLVEALTANDPMSNVLALLDAVSPERADEKAAAVAAGGWLRAYQKVVGRYVYAEEKANRIIPEEE